MFMFEIIVMFILIFFVVVDVVIVEEMCCDLIVLMFGEGVVIKCYDLFEEFGSQCICNILFVEGIIVGIVVGVVGIGLCLVIDLFFVFFFCYVMDELVNSVGKLCYFFGGQFLFLLVMLVMIGGGWGVGVQYNYNNEVWFVYSFGFKVVMLFIFVDFKGLFKVVICDDNLVLFFMDIGLFYQFGEVLDGEYLVLFGKVDVLCQGGDVMFVFYGKIVYVCWQVVEILVVEGIDVDVIDLCSLKLFDEVCILDLVCKIGWLVVVYEVS